MVAEQADKTKIDNCSRHKAAKDSKSECFLQKSGFPPGTTVDNLWVYRRKKAGEYPQDNLRIPSGSFKRLKSEYRRRFKDLHGLFKLDCFKKQEDVNSGSIEEEQHAKDGLQDNVGMSEEDHSAVYSNTLPKLRKRTTNLYTEGEFLNTTEYAEKFIEHILTKRPDLLRTETTLHLEGLMKTRTETQDQFVPYTVRERPPLIKELTNLHLEGSLDMLTTEQQDYKPYQVTRPKLLKKKSTNLHLEGELGLSSEYRSEYKEYKNLERPKHLFPTDNLSFPGFNRGNERTVFENICDPVIPNLREEGSHTPCRSSPTTPKKGSMSPWIGTPRAPSPRPQPSPKVESPRRRRRSSKVFPVSQKELVPVTRDYVNSGIPRHVGLSKKGFRSLEEGEIEILSSPKVTKGITRIDFERVQCQPEYRKAFRDYLTRERIDRKERPLEKLEGLMVESSDPSGNDSKSSKEKTSDSSKVKDQGLPPLAPSSSSSTSSDPRKLSPRNRTLSQLETSVFGPKLTVPKRHKSLKNLRDDYISSTDSESVSKKFSHTVKVENLAYKPPVCPKKTESVNRWRERSSSESDAPFVILQESGISSRRSSRKGYLLDSLGKEQKWMPSWQYPPS